MRDKEKVPRNVGHIASGSLTQYRAKQARHSARGSAPLSLNKKRGERMDEEMLKLSALQATGTGVIKALEVASLKTALTRVKTEYLAAIAESGHITLDTTQGTVPDARSAKEGVLYLVKDGSGRYLPYAKIGEAVEPLFMDASEAGGAREVFEAEKTELDNPDAEVIEAYFREHEGTEPHKGDVFIINSKQEEESIGLSAYIHNGSDWLAMAGSVDADKVILRDNITMAGNYTQVGNKTKTQNGTAEFETKGMSVAEVLTEIFSKRLQPSVTAQPSVGTFTLTGAGAVEAGTKVDSASYSAASLNAGSYTYGPATGVTATSWKVERVTDSGTVQVKTEEAASLAAGSDDNDGKGFIIGDSGGDDTFSSLKYKVTATHGEGVRANDNLGSPSEPEVKIGAGTKTKETTAYTPYRNYFYGATADKPELTGEYVRKLTKSGKAYAAGTITVNVKAGDVRVAIACISGKTGVTKVINESAMNADVTDTFVKSTVQVEGADGYTAKEYNVWTFEPAKAYENAAVLKVTLG